MYRHIYWNFKFKPFTFSYIQNKNKNKKFAISVPKFTTYHKQNQTKSNCAEPKPNVDGKNYSVFMALNQKHC